MVAATGLLLLAATAGLAAPGATPGEAIELTGAEQTGSARAACYYSYVAPSDGIMEVTLMPVSGEVDLSVTHFSGSPTAESRREGAQSDEVALAVRKGDRFLVRVSSPFGAAATFRIRAAMKSEAAVGAPTGVFVPQTAQTGADKEAAVEIPLGKLVPVEASGTRFFKVDATAGFLLAVTVYTVSGDVDVEMSGGEGQARSGRRGEVTEYAYLPVKSTGEKFIRVEGPRDAICRYVLVARLRHLGLATASVPEPNDAVVVRTLFQEEALGAGVPASLGGGENAATKVLRLR